MATDNQTPIQSDTKTNNKRKSKYDVGDDDDEDVDVDLPATSKKKRKKDDGNTELKHQRQDDYRLRNKRYYADISKLNHHRKIVEEAKILIAQDSETIRQALSTKERKKYDSKITKAKERIATADEDEEVLKNVIEDHKAAKLEQKQLKLKPEQKLKQKLKLKYPVQPPTPEEKAIDDYLEAGEIIRKKMFEDLNKSLEAEELSTKD